MRVGILINLDCNITEKIEKMVNMGFSSGQISVWDMKLYTAETADKIKEVCRRLDFTITALWCGWSGPKVWGYPQMYTTLGLVPSYMREKRMNELLLGAEFARMLGLKDIITHVGYLPDNPMDRTHIEVVQVLTYICNILKQYGQSFLFETGEELPLTLVQVINEIGTGNVGVNFDPANLLINARANPCDALDLLAPYVMGVHAKDAVYPVGTNPKGKEVAIGEGKANFPEIIKKLKAAGYDGDLTIEREIRESEQRQKDILSGKVYLESIIRGPENEI
jgi:L-ribulose-5-phosphate 3-epimerase